MVGMGWITDNGEAYFSSNWGFTSTAPILGGNVFNLVFGE